MESASLTSRESLALHTDRYQLAMLAAYAHAGLSGRRAVFELFVRGLPPSRRHLVAAGIGRVVAALTALRFDDATLEHLARDRFLGPALANPSVRAVFRDFRFRGDVWAIPEGRAAFAGEPLVRVEGTLAEAQLVETLLLSAINHDTRIASKCARIVAAADGRDCFEFGTRRGHELAAVDAARAAYLAGFTATSNEAAGLRYGIPRVGTMAHSFILAHAADAGEEGEGAAFAAFCAAFSLPCTCLVDTFDTGRGVELAAEQGERLLGVRIDSGDLHALAVDARARLDQRGRGSARIVLSDDLDEHRIARLLESGTPVDAFGVGTMAIVTPDAPSLGAVYKLVALEDAKGQLVAVQKRSPSKASSSGIKQVHRVVDERGIRDVVSLPGEPSEGEPLLERIVAKGEVIADTSALAARKRWEIERILLSPEQRSLAPRPEGARSPVTNSAALNALHERVAREGRAVLSSR